MRQACVVAKRSKHTLTSLRCGLIETLKWVNTFVTPMGGTSCSIALGGTSQAFAGARECKIALGRDESSTRIRTGTQVQNRTPA